MEILISSLLVLGSFFMLTAAIGILRMPDLYMRMSANAKSVTLGVGTLLLALALHFQEVGVASRALATIAFIAMTVPVSSHLIGRAAYLSGVELWEKTIADELRELYPEGAPHAEPVSFGDEPPHPSGPPPEKN
jgi:multicomponent Na+:H+ antiporter subunit G